MSFGDCSSAAGLEKFNAFLINNAYVSGWVPTQKDVAIFKTIKSSPNADHVNVLRWWKNISSYSSEFAALAAGSAPAAVEEEEEDDDVDLFGSDEDEEETAEAERIKAERVAAYYAKKTVKDEKKGGALIAKSNIILDIKPWDDETPLNKIEESVRSITMDGLLWGTGKLVAIGYGIKKLQISCVVEDLKVSTDDLEDEIMKFEDYIQSMDIVAFNKI